MTVYVLYICTRIYSQKCSFFSQCLCEPSPQTLFTQLLFFKNTNKCIFYYSSCRIIYSLRKVNVQLQTWASQVFLTLIWAHTFLQWHVRTYSVKNACWVVQRKIWRVSTHVTLGGGGSLIISQWGNTPDARRPTVGMLSCSKSQRQSHKAGMLDLLFWTVSQFGTLPSTLVMK